MSYSRELLRKGVSRAGTLQLLTGEPITSLFDRSILRSIGVEVSANGQATLFELRPYRQVFQSPTNFVTRTRQAAATRTAARLPVTGPENSAELPSLVAIRQRSLELQQQIAALLAEIERLKARMEQIRDLIRQYLRMLDPRLALVEGLSGESRIAMLQDIQQLRDAIARQRTNLAQAQAALYALFDRLEALDPERGLLARVAYERQEIERQIENLLP
jgi:uncharacterized coiled-coil protein SlyX